MGILRLSEITKEEVDKLLKKGVKCRRELHQQLQRMRPTSATMQLRLR